MMVVNYLESHEFPSGVKVDYDSSPDEQYSEELESVSSQEDLVKFVDKWRYLLPEINHDFSYDSLISLRLKFKHNPNYAPNCDDESERLHLSLLAPQSMVFYLLRSMQYGVTVGCVILQLKNNGTIVESEDGSWLLSLVNS